MNRHQTAVVSDLGSTFQYNRPWRGATDLDYLDEVNTGSPVTIEVYEGPRLTVGAVVTKVDNHVIGTANELVTAVLSKDPGAPMTLGFTNSFGDLRTVGIVLGTDHDHGSD